MSTEAFPCASSLHAKLSCSLLASYLAYRHKSEIDPLSFLLSFFLLQVLSALRGNEPLGLWGLGENMSHDAQLYTPYPHGIMSDK